MTDSGVRLSTLLSFVERTYPSGVARRNAAYRDEWKEARRAFEDERDAHERGEDVEGFNLRDEPNPKPFQEAHPAITLAYVGFIAACAAARLGHAGLARDVAGTARLTLGDLDDPVHRFLSLAYQERVEQALAGLPAETPMGPEITARLKDLVRIDRYHADRVRQLSSVLEPREHLDAIGGFLRCGEPWAVELERLRGSGDHEKLAAALDALLIHARRAVPESRGDLLDGVMNCLPRLETALARAYLADVLGLLPSMLPDSRMRLLQRVLGCAGRLGDSELATRAFGALEPLLADQPSDRVSRCWPMVVDALASVRALALRGEEARTIALIENLAPASSTEVGAVCLRLERAAWCARQGSIEGAAPAFEEGLAALEGDLISVDRVALTRRVALALGCAPVDVAFAGLDRLMVTLEAAHDRYHTSAYVGLTLLACTESIVLGHLELGSVTPRPATS